MALPGTGGGARGKSDGSWHWILVPASIIGIIVIAAIFVSRRPASNTPPAAVATATLAEASPPAVPMTAQPTGTTSPAGQAHPLAGAPVAGAPSVLPGTVAPVGVTPAAQTLPPPGVPINTTASTSPQPPAQRPQPNPVPATGTKPALKPPPRPVSAPQSVPPATSTIATSTREHPSDTSTTPTSTNAQTSTSAVEDRRTISEAQARSRLWPVVDANYDTVESDCLKIESLGYSDGAYNFLVSDSCANNTLGRWRVDAKTREVSQQ